MIIAIEGEVENKFIIEINLHPHQSILFSCFVSIKYTRGNQSAIFSMVEKEIGFTGNFLQRL